MNGGERGVAQAAGEDVVEADHGHVLRHPDAGPGQRLDHADGHLVVGGDDGIRQLGPGHGQQGLARLLAALDAVEALVEAGELALRVGAQHVVQAVAPLPGVRGIGWPVHPEQAPLAVIADEMGDHGGRAGQVVGRHHVDGLLVRGAREDHYGDTRGQALDEGGGDDPLTDQDAVDLAGERLDPGEAGVVRALQEGDEQRPVMVADPGLHPAQHLVVEQQVHVLDVVLLRLPLHADQADHVLAAAGQALRGAVGHVAELLDGLLDPDPGGLAHPVLAVHDPRHRRGGDAGQARHVEESYHVVPISGMLCPQLPGPR